METHWRKFDFIRTYKKNLKNLSSKTNKSDQCFLLIQISASPLESHGGINYSETWETISFEKLRLIGIYNLAVMAVDNK